MPLNQHSTVQQCMEEQFDPPTPVPNVAQHSSRCCQLAPFECVQIVELKSIGWSYTQIHKQYPHIPIGTIRTTIRQSSMRGPSQETLPQSGTPQKLNNYEKSLLFQAIEESPQIEYSELLALVDYKVSRQTIWQLFQSSNH